MTQQQERRQEKPVEVWRYFLPNEKDGQGWAEVLLTSTGLFVAVGDFGDYTYHWHHRGRAVDFRECFLTFGDVYLRDKLSRPERRRYDAEATLSAVKRHLLTSWREKSYSLAFARKEYALLAEHYNLSLEADFCEWSEETEVGDADEFRRDVDSDAQLFFSRTMPRIKAAIAEEVQPQRLTQGARTFADLLAAAMDALRRERGAWQTVVGDMASPERQRELLAHYHAAHDARVLAMQALSHARKDGGR